MMCTAISPDGTFEKEIQKHGYYEDTRAIARWSSAAIPLTSLFRAMQPKVAYSERCFIDNPKNDDVGIDHANNWASFGRYFLPMSA